MVERTRAGAACAQGRMGMEDAYHSFEHARPVGYIVRAATLTINPYHALLRVFPALKLARSALRAFAVAEFALLWPGAAGRARQMVSLERVHGPPPSPSLKADSTGFGALGSRSQI